MQFVSSEISKLLLSGALIEVSATDLLVCNPLGVTTNGSGKRRHIVDLRFVNQHLRSCKFKYLLHQGDWFSKFDYASGYHHVEIPRLLVDG